MKWINDWTGDTYDTQEEAIDAVYQDFDDISLEHYLNTEHTTLNLFYYICDRPRMTGDEIKMELYEDACLWYIETYIHKLEEEEENV